MPPPGFQVETRTVYHGDNGVGVVEGKYRAMETYREIEVGWGLHTTEAGNETLVRRPRAGRWRAFEVGLRPAGTREAPGGTQHWTRSPEAPS